MASISASPERKWSIYKLTNPEGQVYIGRSSDLKGRFQNYKGLTGKIERQPLLYNSLLKYGFSSHELVFLDKNLPNESESKSKEIFWIRTYMSNSAKWPEQRGLNRTNGGSGTKGLKHSETSKLKTNHPRKGIKLQGKDLERVIKNGEKAKKPIYQYSLEGTLIAEFNSCAEAYLATKIAPSTIWRSLKGIRHFKFIFKYK